MPWPNVADFTAVIQNPSICFQHPDLVSGVTGQNPRGMPLVYSGSFASVYKVSNGNNNYAVRCFTNEVKDQQQRYADLDEYLRSTRPDAFVRFEYLEHGIKVGPQWYPVIKMPWVDGNRLDKFVRDNLKSQDALQEICARWRGANGTLRGLHIAHNDLQHGNVMVQNDAALRLVDYDGIFLPKFRGQNSPEMGHRHYQHPLRSATDYDVHVDNFPALVLYLSLLAVTADPELWDRFNNNENLILTKEDYANPRNSECFQALRSSPDEKVRELAARLEECCAIPVEHVPELEQIVTGSPAAYACHQPAQPPRRRPRARNTAG